MRAFAALHTPGLHLAILRGSAWLVPSRQRAEWLVEWRTELWYAWSELREEPERRSELTAFCLGSYRDALYVRRNAPVARYSGLLQIETARTFPDLPPFQEIGLLDSPVRCLAVLAIMAMLCVAAALLPPSAHHYAGRLIAASALMFAPGWIIARITTAISLKDSIRPQCGGRLLAFFLAKVLLLFAISVSGFGALAALGGPFAAFAAQFYYWAAFLAARWALLDQQERCPVCLCRLSNSVLIGDRSRVFLDWHGTESMCLKGHGLLRVPENSDIGYHEQRWLRFDPFYSGLFR